MEIKDAKYWNKKGDEFVNSQNFEEAINCYGKASQLDSEDAFTLIKWGEALSNLADNKQDESLFRESFDKFKKAI